MQKSPGNEGEREALFKTGIVFILISLILYYFICINHREEDITVPLVFINYGITMFYLLLMLLANTKLLSAFKFRRNSYQYICFLTLATISCFGLNEVINLFDNFSSWVDIYIITMYAGLISTCFLDKLPKMVRIPVFFVTGAGTAMSLYFTLYLLPLMPFGLAGFFALGLPLHLIVPLLVLISFVRIFRKAEKTNNERMVWWVGLTSPIILVFIFMIQWKSTSDLIDKTFAEYKSYKEFSLSKPVEVCKYLTDGFFTQRILKGNLVYSSFGNMWNWGFPGMTMNEKKEHDPLIAIASYFLGDLNLTQTERIDILTFYGKNRHDTFRKLWTGKDLSTSKINTKIKVYPEYRMAYTEHLFCIKNSHKWREEEALYTFELPEGSVATSLSLWVNGVEEQSRLTTRGKADSAYVSIVGVEIRDPALLHWREGNSVTVTVFPCTDEEERIFRIGISSPMALKNSQLHLPEIEFQGPDYSNAERINHVEFPTRPDMDYAIDYYGNLTCTAIPVSDRYFSYGGNTFSMEEYITEESYFNPQNIYLDINRSWSEAEFDEICSIYSGRNIYLYDDQQLISVDKTSTEKFYKASRKNFSLFPVNLIGSPENSLLISKAGYNSPDLSDLEESKFGIKMMENLTKRNKESQAPVRLYNLSENLSGYLETLEEFNVFYSIKGDTDKLSRMAKKMKYPSPLKSINSIVFKESETVIHCHENIENTNSQAPDLLMRMYSYNQILKKIGRGYFESGYENDDLVAIAKESHIVSPISSLIVLETKKDYDRFDIEENEGLGNSSDNGLNKAFVNDSGAVPEPHEWLFIILSVLGLLVLQLRLKRCH